MTTLLIVESPAKARKITQLLGRGFAVAATAGHLQDLPRKDLGVSVKKDPATGADTLVLDLETTEKAGKHWLPNLRRMARGASKIVLATDDDREGEAIAAHAAKLLRLKGEPERIRFNAITRESITRALAKPGRIDRALVLAQGARRALDRVVGYKLSRILTDRLKAGGQLDPRGWVSIGRVQAPVLAAVAEQAEARQNFRPSSVYRAGHLLRGVFFQLPGEAHATAEAALAEARAKPPKSVAKRNESSRSVRPPPAADTTDALKRFANELGGKAVMSALQDLHNAGLITYHRTDSRSLDPGWVKDARSALTAKGLKAGTGRPPEGGKGAHAQGAHEAIRPTAKGLDDPQAVRQLSNTHQRVYSFLKLRAAGACLANGRDRKAEMTLDNGAQATLIQPGEPGWRALAESLMPKPPDAALWALRQGEAVAGAEATAHEVKAKPPAKPTQAWLIAWMKKNGVGRPATYEATITRCESNGMMAAGKDGYQLTPKGQMTLEAAISAAPVLTKARYTADMEAELDRIAAGKAGEPQACALVRDCVARAAGKAGEPRAAPASAAPAPG